MKNFVMLFLLIISNGVFGQIPPEKKQPEEERNPLATVGLNISQRDTIPRDSMVFFTSIMTNYWPRFAPAMFLVAKSRDELHEYIFIMTGSNYIKLEPKEMKGLNYFVDTFNYGGDRGEEGVDIFFKVADVYFHYYYDLTSGKLNAINK